MTKTIIDIAKLLQTSSSKYTSAINPISLELDPKDTSAILGLEPIMDSFGSGPIWRSTTLEPNPNANLSELVGENSSDQASSSDSTPNP